MNQHPVPQHISSYEFKLVGDMTLKQFFQLAGGAVVSLLIYASPMPGYIKWPLVLFFGALGAALAFLPIEERPLSSWIFAFLKAVYSPTIFVYNASTAEGVFVKTDNKFETSKEPEQYLAKPASSGLLDSFEQAEKNFISRVGALFQINHQTITPQPEVSQVQGQPTQGQPQPDPAPQGRIVESNFVQQPTVQQNRQVSGPAFKIEEEFDIPQIQSVKVGTAQIQQAPQQSNNPRLQPIAQYVSPVFQNLNRNLNTTKQATFSTSASPPTPSDKPNTVVGQVLTLDGRIVDGAILEIRDMRQKPVRAIKTNKLGHFLTVTPLYSGEYEIQTEKEGLIFDNVKFRAQGQIIPPIQIKARG